MRDFQNATQPDDERVVKEKRKEREREKKRNRNRAPYSVRKRMMRSLFSPLSLRWSACCDRKYEEQQQQQQQQEKRQQVEGIFWFFGFLVFAAFWSQFLSLFLSLSRSFVSLSSSVFSREKKTRRRASSHYVAHARRKTRFRTVFWWW